MKLRLRTEELESRTCPAAGSTMIPVTSGVGFSLAINSYGRFVEMQVSQAEFNAFSSGSQSAAQDQAVTQRIYAAFPDVFDQIFVVNNQSPAQVPPQTPYYGVHSIVRNTIQGIGTGVVDFSAGFGTSGKLQSYIHLTDRTGIREGVALHEMFHRWANDLQNFAPILGDGAGHWGFSSVGGQLGGWAPGTLQSLGGGLFQADGPLGDPGFEVNANGGALDAIPNIPSGGYPYAPLELYLMGLIPASEVPPITVATGAAMVNPLTGTFTASGFQTITIEDIIRTVGQRDPAPSYSQRDFRDLVVVLTPTAMTQAEIDEMDTQVELYTMAASDGDPDRWNFWEATGGQATVRMDRLQEFMPGNRGVSSFLSVGADNRRIIGLAPVENGTFDVDRPLYPNLEGLLPDFGGEMRVASGDVNGDGVQDFIFATGAGGVTRFGVFDGNLSDFLIAPQQPFRGSEDFTGGAFVSAGDMDGDGRVEIVVSADQGGGSRVVVFTQGGQVLADFFGIDDPEFRGGARTSVGDINGDGRADLVVAAGFGGGPRVAVFNGASLFTGRTKLVSDFFAFPGEDATRLRNGVFVALGDLNGDLRSDLIFGGGPGGAPRLFILSGALVANGLIGAAQAAPVANFFVNQNQSDRGGVRVAVKYVDRDSNADVVVGSGENSLGRVTVYAGAALANGVPKVLQDFVLFNEILPGGVYVG